MQLLKTLLPKLSKVSVLYGVTSPATAEFLKEAQLAAQTFGVELRPMAARDPAEIDAAIPTAQMRYW